MPKRIKTFQGPKKNKRQLCISYIKTSKTFQHPREKITPMKLIKLQLLHPFPHCIPYYLQQQDTETITLNSNNLGHPHTQR